MEAVFKRSPTHSTRGRYNRLVWDLWAALREYMGYIEQLDPDHCDKLTEEEGESTAAIRRRLGAAAQLLGRELVVTWDGHVVYFWGGE